jgi:protein arginine kinase activator
MKDCEICKRRESQVEIAIYLNDKLIRMQVCTECASDCKVDFDALEKGTVPDFIEQCLAIDQKRQRDDSDDIACPECGLTTSDFEDSGQLGCSTCYDALRPLLDDHIRDASPEELERPNKQPSSGAESIVSLQRKLRAAVDREEYEDAAVLRDKINALQLQQEQATDG